MNDASVEKPALTLEQKATAARDQEVIDLVRDIIPQLNLLVDRIERFADKQIQLRQE